jgi:hypothetical protein
VTAIQNFCGCLEVNTGRPIKTDGAGRQTLGSQRPFPGIWKPLE